MLLEARDLVAAFNFENRLIQLREEYMHRVLGGQQPEADFWPRREAMIVDEVRRVFFNQKVRDLIQPADAAPLSDAEDYARRTQARMEDVTLTIHRILAAIPFVGQPEYEES
jgi:hypothetical protein